MSTRTFCDGCGAELVPLDPDNAHLIFTYNARMAPGASRPTVQQLYDLCLACRIRVQEAIKRT